MSGQAKRRRRTTRPTVRWADRTARWTIAVGGLGTILAVSFVALFLIWVVLPLFRGARASVVEEHDWEGKGQSVRHVGIDSYGRLVWTYQADGTFGVYRRDTGRRLQTLRPLGDAVPTAHWFALRGHHAAFGFSDGSIRFGQVAVRTSFIESDDLPAPIRSLPRGAVAEWRGGLVERMSDGPWRWHRLHVELQPPVKLKTDVPIRRLDVSFQEKRRIFAALDDNGKLHLGRLASRKNLLTGKVTLKVQEGVVAVPKRSGRLPRFLKLTGLGDVAIVAWSDGVAFRYDVHSIKTPHLVEEVDLVPEPDGELTSAAFLIGKTSLVTGDSAGRIRIWFRVKPEGATTSDGAYLVAAHRLPDMTASVTALAASPRSRMLAALDASGHTRLYHATSEQVLIDRTAGRTDNQPRAIAVAPKDDRIVVAGRRGFATWSLDVPHPETTIRSVFGKVWYEGYREPQHVWQSSSGTDDFEPKYGLVPLVFGTFKATFYSLIFAVPLAWLAAIYTSEFMTPRAKRVVKPTIEMMASLPSVVLGFLAALVFAPWVETFLPALLAAGFCVPFCLLLGAHLWQLLPAPLAVRLEGWRIWCIPPMILAGLWAAGGLGPQVERQLFAGNWKAWLDGQVGTGLGGWYVASFPLVVLLEVWLLGRFVSPAMRRRAARWPASAFAIVDLCKFLVATLIALAATYVAAYGLSHYVGDLRGSLVGTYVQRNALVVGLVMGFAVIPIVYTLSEDALSAVPDSLRAASLAAGATPWQTAVRVVVPTAMSGLFSAVMIGLGRAVGETMIVLMAAGNTPIMEWNIFNGFRTLSANIAVELPEAVVGSTHYRMLFVAALVLFAITFLINTAAELVRIRFRKRAFQL